MYVRRILLRCVSRTSLSFPLKCFFRPGTSWQVHSDVSVAFSSPFLFDGVGVGGIPEYIRSCANGTNFFNFLTCSSLKVCVAIGTEAYEIAQQRLHPNQIVEVATLDEVYTQFGDGCCNVIGTDYAIERTQNLVEDVGGYSGPYALGPLGQFLPSLPS